MSESLEDIIRHSGYSHSAVNKMFRRYLNKTAAQCFVENKLNFAAKQLLTDNMKIIDIAYSVGYENEKHFIKLFKDAYGITPHKWRLINSPAIN